MKLQRLRLTSPNWYRQADGSDPCIDVDLFRTAAGVHHLVVWAPNWANALRWGEQAALLAWTELSKSVAGLPNPSDPATDKKGLLLWLVRPGFPKPGYPLWKDGFEYYASVKREAEWVYPVSPVPGKHSVTFGKVRGLGEAQAVWVV